MVHGTVTNWRLLHDNAAGRGEGVIPQVLADALEDGLGEDGLPAEPATCFACYCFFVFSVLLFFVFLRV